MKIDWRKHDRNAPDSTYVRLAKPGDILRFPNDSRLWQVQSVTETKNLVGTWKVKFYGRSTPVTFGRFDRAKLFFRFTNPDRVEDLSATA
ncbi:hypothetical protein PBI_DAMIEN_62 [Mycobacterium phage Damien]|uniref:hypothetical protein n=1 Tax=Mycobacterium phage Damien TaxID=1486469 RepID=UPI00045F7482|nr:hypothetical protein HL12_gp62 [Mycobacterium phage Damien]AVO26040.1 hypothetical protein SEA_THUMB_63 [Mycobacterium phage Thumb]AXH47187.1 hypothetical protein SEA_CBORCH11_64 [Mycobacterium phage Cborch11]QDH84925.1 hypothetical protein SEA_Phreeze_61 [Mycobacterium phage Phreeze]QLF83946.1 hypothetical protein SEA_BECKERTON_61 [Mycobacterium phage Beckerton]AHZ95423.1 hypothetical protein PBI_DAMIEN_62 [Mycobacterium phage Damien]